MGNMKVTSLAKFYALVLLSEKPHHGYDLIQYLSGKLGRKVSPGQIYPFLALLEKKRLVTSREAGPRDKKTYSLTREGRAFVKEMLGRFGDIIQHALESSVKKCAHCDCEIFRGGFRKKVRGKSLLFCCERCAAAFG